MRKSVHQTVEFIEPKEPPYFAVFRHPKTGAVLIFDPDQLVWRAYDNYGRTGDIYGSLPHAAVVMIEKQPGGNA